MPIIIIPPYRPAQGGGGGGTDPNFANVKSLLHFDSTNGSTTFADVKGGNTWSVQSGSPTISTTQSKFGGSSLRIPDTSRNIISCTNASLVAGSNDVTLEFWVYLNAISSYQYFTDSSDATTFITASSGGDVQLYANGGWRSLGCTAISATSWTHIAYVRSSGVWSGFVNGVKGSSTYSYSGQITASNKLCIGAQPLGGAWTCGMNGYMDDFRLTIGTARYTANFTPSASAFPDS